MDIVAVVALIIAGYLMFILQYLAFCDISDRFFKRMWVIIFSCLIIAAIVCCVRGY